ncbi:unnamed protein product, partial [Owenia fusiformis]
AGILTTQVVISAFLQLMILHPEVQTRLQCEIDSVVGASRAPSIEDRDAMPVLQANIHEILRYVSHVPIAVPHKTTVDTSIGGYDIPKSTQVWMNLFSMHHDENMFECLTNHGVTNLRDGWMIQDNCCRLKKEIKSFPLEQVAECV